MNCDKCNRSLRDESGEIARDYPAVAVKLDDSEAMSKIYPELDLPFQVNLCYVCYLEGCGYPILYKSETPPEFL